VRALTPDEPRLTTQLTALVRKELIRPDRAARFDLAEVLALGGQDPRVELDQALTLYELKGNLVMAERTRSRLAQ
jgi:hypothetical protein